MSFQRILWVLAVALQSLAAHAQEKLSKEEVRVKLNELNAACEAAREKKLAPLRNKFIEECISKQRKEPDYYQRFYADYGGRTRTRGPLFLDLPECVEAFEFKRKHRVR